MTVSELIEKLQQVDGDRTVVLQKDPEGNDYSPLDDFWIGAYRPATAWYGEAGLECLTDEDKADGYTEEDVIENGQSAIFLCPVD